MKKVLAIIIALLPLITMGQVRVASAATPVDNERKFQYDSLRNCPLIYAEQCRGQELFLLPKKRLYGFHKNGEKYSIADMSNHVGHVFDVIDVINGKEYVFAELVLRDKETKEEFTYSFPTTDAAWPFITLGYKEKFESTRKGKQYVALIYSSFHDFNTGEALGSIRGTVWTFEEIIASAEGEINYLFTNDKGNAISLNKFWLENMFPKSDIDNYISLYGKSLVSKAIDGEILIGMPADLVKVAMGKPDKINSASYGQQWVYKNRYIYLKDGKVTDWN